MNANWRSTNSPNVVWIDTRMHRCTAMEEDVRYPLEDMRQGRDCKTPVPKFSMLAGKPIDSEQEIEHAARALFWQSYVGCLVLIAIVSVVIKVLA